MSRKDLRQKWLAATLGITVPSVSDKLKGITPFTTDELMTIAGALGLSLSELLGEDIVNAKLPAPSYIEEKGKKKVAPIGFIPKGATYQIISGEECALWGSNPRPADYQTQQTQRVTQHTTRQSTTGPTTGLFSCPSTLDVQPITAHREKKNHALGTTAEQLYDLATRFRKSNLNRYDPHTLDPVPRAHLPIRDGPDHHRRSSYPMACKPPLAARHP